MIKERKTGEPESKVYRSTCCVAPFIRRPSVDVSHPWPGLTCYRYYDCEKCKRPCCKVMVQLFDSNGTEILWGDILECPDVSSPNHAERYHAVYGDSEDLIIRDLGNNNVDTYECWDKFYTLGPYWENLDKVSDDDLDYYWDDTREGALEKAKK